MPVNSQLDRVELRHPNGASAQVLLYGATVVSWKSPSSSGGDVLQERLFVSSKSALDGSKPVRGGIPVVFPIFGPPSRPEDSKLTQHGFARSSIWQWEDQHTTTPHEGSVRPGILMDNESGVSISLVLEPIEAISKLWPYNFKLAYVVTLAAHQLSTDLHVLNQSGQHIDFQALLHTYYAVNAATTKVTPLTGLTYLNKVNGGVEETEQRQEVDVTSFTDSVYKDAVEKSAGRYKITDGSVSFELHTRGFKDLVVWNPNQEAGSKMGDMESGGWDRFICVEPGSASYLIGLEAGAAWRGGQTITVL